MRYKIFFVLISLFSLGLNAQTTHKFGITIGGTSFISDTEAFTTEQSIGIALGLSANFVFNRRSELTLEAKYNRHQVNFKGRPTLNAPLEDLQLVLKQLEIPLTYTYNIVSTDNFKFGLNAGASANIFYEYGADDEAKGDYLLDPNNIRVKQLYFDTDSENIGLNVFLISGLSFKFWKKVQLTPRYYYGLMNPYRQAPNDNPLSNYETQVSYYFLGLTYYL
ncbi:Outer membrane protein beta-barrel domain-containing protein [Flavobacteriaceae bacterium MAR_2010_188]|nr:Outer membrane protein beta-barrel domain-containing protein [Flavobacteriaceae bacterium MAR_2010_188]